MVVKELKPSSRLLTFDTMMRKNDRTKRDKTKTFREHFQRAILETCCDDLTKVVIGLKATETICYSVVIVEGIQLGTVGWRRPRRFMRPPIHTSSLRLAEKYYLCRIAQKHRQQRWHPFALLRSVRARCVGTFHNATVRIHDSTNMHGRPRANRGVQICFHQNQSTLSPGWDLSNQAEPSQPQNIIRIWLFHFLQSHYATFTFIELVTCWLTYIAEGSLDIINPSIWKSFPLSPFYIQYFPAADDLYSHPGSISIL